MEYPDSILEKMITLSRALERDRQFAYHNIPGDLSGMEQDGVRLAELVVALHNWITSGGLLPKCWRKS